MPPDSTLMMFAGALFFWYAARVYGERRDSMGYRLWVDSQEPICAGLITSRTVGLASRHCSV